MAGRALPEPGAADRGALHEALARVQPERSRQSGRAAFTAFDLAKAEAARLEMAGFLRAL